MIPTQRPLNTKGADLAMSIEKVLKKLTVCLEQETKAILENKQGLVQELHKEKLTLMEQYRSLSEGLERDKDGLNGLDDDIRAHLKEVSARFQTALQDNLKAIKSAHNAVGRLMDRIMTTARRALMQDQQQYNAHGALTGGGHKGSMMPTRVDQQL